MQIALFYCEASKMSKVLTVLSFWPLDRNGIPSFGIKRIYFLSDLLHSVVELNLHLINAIKHFIAYEEPKGLSHT